MFGRRIVRTDGWYVRKSFAHFDTPLDFENAIALVSTPTRVTSHAFRPFIGYVESKRRFRKEDGRAITSTKDRPLRYCSHQDGYIHSFYAKQLSEHYERFIRDNGLTATVIGYRKGLGTNVDLAKAAFEEIRRRSSCCVIALDISSFFDCIDHKILKDNLCEMLGGHLLSSDWYNVYKSMTKFSWVEIDQLAKRLGFDENYPPRPICSVSKFRNLVRGDDGIHESLINRNANRYGIPQGSPLSALFSNIYMAHFDLACASALASSGSFYRRYSDDIFIITDTTSGDEAIDLIKREMNHLGPALKINDEKTEVSLFQKLASGVFECDKPITYLGLTYDGKRTLLRGRTISRYYRRMTYATRQAVRTAQKSKSKKVFLRKLYRDLSHLGHQNFYTYAKRTSKTLDDPTAVRQLRRHFSILHRKLRSRGK